MKKHQFTILLIDDEQEMNERLSSLLSGLSMTVEDFFVDFQVDYIQIDVEKKSPEYWVFTENTMKKIMQASKNNYDLVMTDYGLVDDEAKEILWGKDRNKKPTPDDAKGRMLTLKELSDQYFNWCNKTSPNLFLKTENVFLYSFASKLAFDLAGPVVPDRLNVTKAAFPNATVEAFDPRNAIYGGDSFYKFYDQEAGRDFYRQIIGFHLLEVAKRYALKKLHKKAGKMHIRKSIINIALFAGLIASISGLTQYLGSNAVLLLKQDHHFAGWFFALAGAMVLVIGTISLALYFQNFTKKIIEWVDTEG